MDRLVEKTKNLAIVMARGGSKGLKDKNLRLLNGYPLLAYSIASALASNLINRVILTTDNDLIAETGRKFGAEVPFRRPEELAGDHVTDYPVIAHALQWLESEENYQPDVVVQLRPTTPFRPRGLLDKAIATLLESPANDCVRGVTKAGENPYKMWSIDGNDYLIPLLESEFDEPYNMPRQQLPVVYWQTGHVDAIRRETILAKQSLTGDKVKAILIGRDYCLDIDTKLDIELANWWINNRSLDIDFPVIKDS
ncbi:cytidylyltransferase domain-containing protein [Gemmatimonadota bacterium]